MAIRADALFRGDMHLAEECDRQLGDYGYAERIVPEVAVPDAPETAVVKPRRVRTRR